MSIYDYYLDGSYSLDKLYAERDFLIAQHKQGLLTYDEYINQLADILYAIELHKPNITYTYEQRTIDKNA